MSLPDPIWNRARPKPGVKVLSGGYDRPEGLTITQAKNSQILVSDFSGGLREYGRCHPVRIGADCTASSLKYHGRSRKVRRDFVPPTFIDKNRDYNANRIAYFEEKLRSYEVTLSSRRSRGLDDSKIKSLIVKVKRQLAELS